MARRTPRPELTAEQRAEADRIHAALLHAAEGDLRELADLLATTDDSNTFGATEFAVRDLVLRVGAKAVETALAGRERGYDGSSRVCPTCGEAAKFQRWQFKPVVTPLGVVRVERAYDHCRPCHGGHGPRDTRLGLDGSDLSRGATEAVALAGTVGSFAEAASKTLPKLCGLRVSESTVERVRERAARWCGRSWNGWTCRGGVRRCGRSTASGWCASRTQFTGGTTRGTGRRVGRSGRGRWERRASGW